MKKSLAIIVGCLFFLGSMGSLAGCNKQSPKENPIQPTSTAESAKYYDNMFNDNLIGDWKHVQGEIMFEEMSIDKDGAYSTFLHARPFDNGTWKVENKVVTFTSSGDTTLDRSYMIVEAYGKSIRWLNTKEGLEEVWARIME